MNKIALVTGAARGIGRAIAIDLARHGFDIAGVARSLDSPTFADKPGTLMETAEQVNKLGRKFLPIKMDLLEQVQIRAGFEKAMNEFSRLDLLVTSGNYMETGPEGTYMNKFIDVPWDAFERHARITGLSTLYLNQLAAQVMVNQRSGVVINITQNAVWLNDPEAVDNLPMPGEGMPGMAVSVMRGITDRIPASIKREMAPHGVSVLTLDPGMTISVDRQLWSLVETIGYKPEIAHSVAVPARTVVHIATSSDPLQFSGRLVVAPEHIRQFGLLTEAEMYPDPQSGIQDVTKLPMLKV
ncbi:MAG TPA: SDR family NAD(P)-dependent oxidoreductase [Steroidobacteraceae bacterium]|jgi:NAD(P)-dependent dehydrogenase (short-subunit alcohol dehydrogenase family)